MVARIDKFDLSSRKRRLLSIYDFLNSREGWPPKQQLSNLILDPAYPGYKLKRQTIPAQLVDLANHLSVLSNLGVLRYSSKKDSPAPDMDIIYYGLETTSIISRHELVLVLHLFTSTVLFHADQAKIALSMFHRQKAGDPNSVLDPDKDAVLSRPLAANSVDV